MPANPNPSVNEILDKVIDKDGIRFSISFETIDMLILLVGVFASVLLGSVLAHQINKNT